MEELEKDIKMIIVENLKGLRLADAIFYFDIYCNQTIFSCSKGSISQLYTKEDTDKFAKKHYDAIVELLNEKGIDASVLSFSDMSWSAFKTLSLRLRDEILIELYDEYKTRREAYQKRKEELIEKQLEKQGRSCEKQ